MESLQEGGDSEVVFKEEEQGIGDSTPPTPITTCDMEVIIRGWEEKFERIPRSPVSVGESQLRHVQHQ